MNLKDFENKGKVNFASIELQSFQQPVIEENSNQDWIGYGTGNSYPDYLIDLYQNSSINSALIKGISAQIYGKGLDATDKEEKPEQWLQLQLLLEKNPDALKNACFDLKLHGYCFLNTIWNRTRTKIAEIKHIPAQTIRTGKANMSGEIEEYYYSPNWSDYRKGQNRPKGIKAFNTTDRTEASQLLMIKDYSPRVFYYASPDYVGSTNWIQLDVQIADFHLNNISNGLFPSMSIAFNNGIPTDEARQEIERKLQAKFSGNQNAGRLMITFNDGADNAPVIEPINSNGADGLYQYLSTECKHKILSGHRITSPLLLGIRDAGGGFGNNADELRDSFELLQGIVVKPFQDTMLNGLSKVFAVNGINLDLYFKTLKPAAFLEEEIVEVVSEEDAEKEGVSFSSQMDVDRKPTKGMVEEAQKGLEWRKEFGRGGTQVAVARARDISQKKNLSPETIRRMKSFFARHEVDKQGEGFSPGEDGFPSAGRIAWALWGGDAGQSWSEKKVKELDRIREENLSTPFLDDDTGKVLLSQLEKYQENIDDDEWFELGEMEMDEQEHEEHFEKFVNNSQSDLYKFYSIPQESPNKKSQSDVGLIRVLYRYSQNIATNTRPFCRGMVAASKGGAKYTVDNLQRMSQQSLNPDFAHTGSTYDIWQWKGGVFCHHRWIRVFYLRKRVPKGEEVLIEGKIYKGGQYLPPTTLDNFRKTYQAEINKLGFNWSKVRGLEPQYTTAAPINTPLRGAFPGGRFAPGK